MKAERIFQEVFKYPFDDSNKLMFEIPNEFDHPNTPEKDEDFYFERSFLRDFKIFIDYRVTKGFYYFGPQGSGKSDGIRQWCAYTGTPIYEINGSHELSLADLYGDNTYNGEKVVWVDGPLIRAMRYGGIFCLHEVSYCRATIIGALNIVLDSGDKFVVPNLENEVIKIHPDFRFVVTDNTNGTGDNDGIYLGAKPLPGPFVDRFTMCQASYLPKNIEVSILLNKCPLLNEQTAGAMVDLAEQTRKMFNRETSDDSTISSLISTRTLINWGKLIPLFKGAKNPVLYALERAFVLKLPRDEAEGFVKLAETFFSI